MKVILTFLTASAALIAAASADWVIESKVEGGKTNGVMTVKVKGDKMRIDIPNERVGAVSSIVDTKTGDTIQVIHSRKMAMKMDGAAMKQMLEAARQKAGTKEAETAELKATGETEKVDGIDCDIYGWTNGSVAKRLWVARNHPQAAALKVWEKQMREGFFGALKGGPDTSKLPGPTVKTETTSQGVTTTNTVTSIKEQDVDAKDFEVPEGYQSVPMPSLPAAN